MDSPLGKLRALVESNRVPILSSQVSSIGPSSTSHFFTWDREPIIRAMRCFSDDWLERSLVMVSHVRVVSLSHLDTRPSIHRSVSGCCLPNNCSKQWNFIIRKGARSRKIRQCRQAGHTNLLREHINGYTWAPSPLRPLSDHLVCFGERKML